ncbi:MAG: hypothetical protein P9F75_19060 [Candidatus Contendobacter sp.]|nr:hypothetical protein [Candidatus Contendobacter sp.]
MSSNLYQYQQAGRMINFLGWTWVTVTALTALVVYKTGTQSQKEFLVITGIAGFSILHFITGKAVKDHKEWGRYFGTFFGFIYLPLFFLGGYFLWIFIKKWNVQKENEGINDKINKKDIKSSFIATQTNGLFKPKWKVLILEESINFSEVEGSDYINLTKEEVKNFIEFYSAFVSGYNIQVKYKNKQYEFNLDSNDLSTLRSWMTPKTASEVAFDIKQAVIIRGIGLILVGLAHFIFSNYLNPVWGGILIIIGALSFFMVSRYMFLLNGILLILVSILNGYAFITAASKGLHMSGGIGVAIFFQFIWGIEEIFRFREYSFSEIEGDSLEHDYKTIVESANTARPETKVESRLSEREAIPEVSDQAAKLRARLDALAKARADKESKNRTHK